MRRLARELEVIDRLGFTDYFVVVGEICRHAHRRGIPTVGRGSGASSIVTYLLGITNVDPLRYRLYFERFLHDQRRDLPDLDIDLCWRRRDDVIQHVYETYGADHVAMISTHNTFGARGAFRDAARAHGMAPDTVDRSSRLIPRNGEAPLARLLAPSPRGRDVPLEEPRFQRLLAAADRLIGLPRHLGIHPGGIVITDRPLDHYVPLEEATKGIVVTQYEMHAVEAVGLVKIDLLGNRAISVISETVELVRAGGGPVIDPAAIPDGDGATARLMRQGDTLGVFQLESPGMRNLLRQLETRDLDGAIAALSLIRPGPAGSGMKERFIRRARGLEPVEFLDPRLAEPLGDTYGVMLYEEDVMAVSAALAGLSLADGDMLRRAVAGIESPEDEEALRRVFVARAERNDTSPAVAAQAWSEIRRFAAYAFCKAHASGYGVLAWQGSWLKAHHPAAFAVAILNNHTAMYDQRVHLEDARRHGVEIRLPCVNRSGAEFTLESEGAGPGRRHPRRTRPGARADRGHARSHPAAAPLPRPGRLPGPGPADAQGGRAPDPGRRVRLHRADPARAPLRAAPDLDGPRAGRAPGRPPTAPPASSSTWGTRWRRSPDSTTSPRPSGSGGSSRCWSSPPTGVP